MLSGRVEVFFSRRGMQEEGCRYSAEEKVYTWKFRAADAS